MNELSYDTLHDIWDMLNKKIYKEKISTTLFNFNKDELTRLQKDKRIIELSMSKLIEKTYYEVQGIKK